jgi:hypothetical protein
MKNLAMSQVMVGANMWDARGHVMSGSNDIATRREIFKWIRDHEKTFYRPREPMHPVGVYFSPATRNYFTEEFLHSYQGILILLMQKHLEYQIVTPRTLAGFKGATLVLPDVRVLDDSEHKWLQEFVAAGHTLVVTGQDATGLSSPQVVHIAQCPGKAYSAALEKDFPSASPESQQAFLESLKPSRDVVVEASSWLATHIVRVDGKPHVFFANFKGLRPKENAIQSPETGAKITASGAGKAYFLPFLGEVHELRGEKKDGRTVYLLPPIERGAVVWWDTP